MINPPWFSKRRQRWMVLDSQGKALDQWLKSLEQTEKPKRNFILRAPRGKLLRPRFGRHRRTPEPMQPTDERQIERRMDELAAGYSRTHDEKVKAEIFALAGLLAELKKSETLH